jgi:hypothetical protein
MGHHQNGIVDHELRREDSGTTTENADSSPADLTQRFIARPPLNPLFISVGGGSHSVLTYTAFRRSA